MLRVRDTKISKVKDAKWWMIFVDELFKGKNTIDAIRSSIDVIDGFGRVRAGLFVTSTHLYEIAGDLQHAECVAFRQMETFMEGDQFWFTYQLKEDISNECIGDSIMKQEGVLGMLHTM